MPQTPNRIQSPVTFQPVTLSSVEIVPPYGTEDVTRPNCIQLSSDDEPITEQKLFGPFRTILRITGLDCTAVSRVQLDPSYGKQALFSRILAVIVLLLTLFRCVMFFMAGGKVLSFQWTESNMYAFMAIHSIVCGGCLFGWTKNGFFFTYLEMLNKVRKLRVNGKKEKDDYTKLHRRAFFWAALWFLAVMSHSVASMVAGKILFGGEPVNKIICVAFPFITFLVCVVVTTCVIIYFLINCSMSREIKYFNEELQEAVNENRLHNEQVLLDFCHRQAELIRLVKKANESLTSYAGIAPIFCFYGFINGIYIASFQDVLSTLEFSILIFNLIAVIAMTIFTLQPTSNVQYHLSDTSRILMDCEEFEKNKNRDNFRNYHIIVDRSLKTDTRIRVVGGIPINQTTMNTAMLLIPNLGSILALVRKTLIVNGVQV